MEYSLDENTNQLRWMNQNLVEVIELLKQIAANTNDTRFHLKDIKQIVYANNQILNKIYESLPSNSK